MKACHRTPNKRGALLYNSPTTRQNLTETRPLLANAGALDRFMIQSLSYETASYPLSAQRYLYCEDTETRATRSGERVAPQMGARAPPSITPLVMA